MLDPYNCISQQAEFKAAAAGPLLGRTFVVKENIDVQGLPTTAGNPDYADRRGLPEKHAWAVEALLQAGAVCIGKTHCHEITWGLTGVNPHFGTPVNPLDASRIPGGSSSGSAVAVGAGLADLALGTDTGGSIRLPASLCGVWGLRPTWGRVPALGTVPLAPSFDTVGLFSRTASLLRDAFQVLLSGEETAKTDFRQVILPSSMPDLDAEAADALERALKILQDLGLQKKICDLPDLDQTVGCMRALQGPEVLREYREWWQSGARLGEDVTAMRRNAEKLTLEEVGAAVSFRQDFSSRMNKILTPGTLMLLPCAPGLPPTLEAAADRAVLRSFLRRVLQLIGPASVAGLPALAWPLRCSGGLAVGMQLIAAPGQDLSLLELGVLLESGCGQERPRHPRYSGR